LAFGDTKFSEDEAQNGPSILSYPKNEVLSRNVFPEYIPIDPNRYSESEGGGDLEKLFISGRLINKFLDDQVKFPEVPVNFKGYSDYEAVWQYLL
jgi:hypothetical protein